MKAVGVARVASTIHVGLIFPAMPRNTLGDSDNSPVSWMYPGPAQKPIFPPPNQLRGLTLTWRDTMIVHYESPDVENEPAHVGVQRLSLLLLLLLPH